MSGASSKRNSAVGRSLDAKAGYLIAFTDGYALPQAGLCSAHSWGSGRPPTIRNLPQVGISRYTTRPESNDYCRLHGYWPMWLMVFASFIWWMIWSRL